MLTEQQRRELDWEKTDGLMPVIVQHAVSGEVLMLGYMNPEAGNDSNLLIVFYVQIMPDDFVMQLHR
ncbi:hypothetical protein R9K83_01100, partial [Escherichia coli]